MLLGFSKVVLAYGFLNKFINLLKIVQHSQYFHPVIETLFVYLSNILSVINFLLLHFVIEKVFLDEKTNSPLWFAKEKCRAMSNASLYFHILKLRNFDTWLSRFNKRLTFFTEGLLKYHTIYSYAYNISISVTPKNCKCS